MYNSLQSNPFERETDLLERPEIREEILIIYLAAAALAQSNWKQSLDQISKYKQMLRHSRLEQQEALQLQIKFMEAFCAFKTTNYSQAEQMVEDMLETIIKNVNENSDDRSFNKSMNKNQSKSLSLADISQKEFSYRNFAVKVYTLAANLIITQQKTQLDFKQVKKGLIQLLEPQDMRQFIPEVLGTLTGCKYFKPVIGLKNLEGKLSGKLAKKMQILADWKFIAGLLEQAISFKQKAILIWQEVNSHKQLQQCKKELQQLKQSNSKSQYKLRLSRIRVFAEPVIKLQPDFDVNVQSKRPIPLIKLVLPVLLGQLKVQSEEKLKPKQSIMSESKIKKQSLLGRITSECELFYQAYKEQIGGQVTNLLLNSKFVDEQFKKVRKCLSIFQKIRALRMRQVFNRLNRNHQMIKFQKAALISKFSTSDLK